MVPGATPGKWIERFRERFPHVELRLVEIDPREQRAAMTELDAALVRLPLDTEGLHVIALYDEVPVVVMAKDSALSIAEELDPGDLAGETLIVPGDDVLALAPLPGTLAPAFPTIDATADVVATVASGAGITIVPMSLARLHDRADTVYRELRGGSSSTVALAWPADRTTEDVEAFVGIVRGRTPNSSR